MKTLKLITSLSLALTSVACGTTSSSNKQPSIPPSGSKESTSVPEVKEQELGVASGQFLSTVNYNGVSVKIIVDKPETASADIVMTYHGTVETDDKIVEAARKTLEESKKMTSRKDVMFISVAYPEENLLMGDNLKHAEAALLWVKNKGKSALKIDTKRIFLLGHSQGGYLVTRLNTMHSTDGVIANAPGPLDFKFRCELEESGKIPASGNCQRIKNKFGSTSANPNAYLERSLLAHLEGQKSRIVFTQGMSDSKIQLSSWPKLKEKLNQCNNCAEVRFEELDGQHGALFANPKGAKIFEDFIQ